MKKLWRKTLAVIAMLTTVFTSILPTTPVLAAETQYWTESTERVGIVEKVMNDGSIGSTFNEGLMTVEADASTRMSAAQISDVALSLEYIKQYAASHPELNYKQVYLLEQCMVWRTLSVYLGWSCDNVRAAYDEIPQAVQDEVYANAKAFAAKNSDRYDCGGYIYSGEGQELGQFWAKLAVGNAIIQKVSSDPSVSADHDCYSLAGATYGLFSDQDCTAQVATLTTDRDGNTETVEVRAGTLYVKELSAPTGFKVDSTVYTLTVKAGETATLKVSDTPKATSTEIELFKIDMETGKAEAQGAASLEGAEFVWNYYDGYYTKETLPSEPTRTWTTKTVAETDRDGTTHYVTGLDNTYKVSGDDFYVMGGKNVLPLGTLTVQESKSPTGYLLEGAYLQAEGSEEQIKGLYVTQITEDGDLAVLSGSNQFSVSDQVIRGGVKIQKRDLETGDTKAQGGATFKDAAFEIVSLNDNPVLVEGKLYQKNEVVKTIHTGIDGIAATSSDLLPYGDYQIRESKAPAGYLTEGAKPVEFSITEDGQIVDLTGEETSIYNQVKRGDIEGVKMAAGTHKRLANVPFKITSVTTGESHIVVTDENGQFSTSSEWTSHKNNTNRGESSTDGVWFGTSEPDDSKGALLYDTYEIEELRCDSNKGLTLIPAFQIVVSRDNLVIDLGTLTDEYEKELTIHTTAADPDGEKSIVAGHEVTIVDTVSLDGLEKGQSYQLVGWQMDKTANAELLVNGARVEAETTFTADRETMEIEMEFTFDAAALAGKDLVTFEELYLLPEDGEPELVAQHKDIEDEGQTVSITEREISIHTTATDPEGAKELTAGKELTIVDKVRLDGLEKGVSYRLVGWQMVKEEQAELLIDGKRVESDLTFTAEDSSMELELTFTFKGKELAGKSLVTFEELYDLTNPEKPEKVAEHTDLEDEGQTVTIKEREITIHTNAADKETGKKVIDPKENVTIVDTVTIEGMEVGTEYLLKGWQMDKETGEKLLIDGQPVEKEYRFTAEDSNMEIQIEFTFNASTLAGKSLVTFEELYDLTNPEEPEKVAEHTDIEDEGQTVTVSEEPEEPKTPEEPETPETPETPQTPQNPGTTTQSTNAPKTGDMTNLALWFALLGVSAAGLLGAYLFKKYKETR